MDKGTLSNLVSAALLVTGLSLPTHPVQALILSMAMFAFSGGVTNSLAVKMLFDRIPGLVGSGVISARFKEIRQQIKQLIVKHFFSKEDLRRFFAENADEIQWDRYVKQSDDGANPLQKFVEAQWEKLTHPEAIDSVIAPQLAKIRGSMLGGFLFKIGQNAIENEIMKFVSSFLESTKGKVLEASARFKIDQETLNMLLDEDAIAEDLQPQIEILLDTKLQQLDAERVKVMIEDVIRNHLGWLVVWGNILGGLLGVAAYFINGQLAGS